MQVKICESIETIFKMSHVMQVSKVQKLVFIDFVTFIDRVVIFIKNRVL